MRQRKVESRDAGIKNLRKFEDLLREASTSHWDEAYLTGPVLSARPGNLEDVQRAEDIIERMDAELVQFRRKTNPDFTRADIEDLSNISFEGLPEQLDYFKGRNSVHRWLTQLENQHLVGLPRKEREPSMWKRLLSL